MPRSRPAAKTRLDAATPPAPAVEADATDATDAAQETPVSAEAADAATDTDTPQRLLIGIIGAPHGIRGDMRVRLVTDFPERLASIAHVYLGDEEKPRRLRSLRIGGENSAILDVAGISQREEAGEYRGTPLYIDIRDAKPLEEDEYYWHQLIDMTVVTPEGDTLGTLTSIMQTGANDVYIVRQSDGKDLLLPAIKDVVLEIDVPNKRMVAKPLEFL